MEDFIAWIRAHRWESATIVLSALLLVAVVLLGLNLSDDGGQDDQEALPDTATTTTEPERDTGDTNAPGDTTTSATDADPPVVEGPGPFGGDSPSPVTAVVVDNVPDVGFQIGIDQAPLLIEVPVEGGLTRYTALYGDTVPELIGPVRSLRPVSADLLALFRPVVFTSGGQPFVTGMVEGAGATIVTPEDSVAFQTLERPRPYHLFVTPGVEGIAVEPVSAPWEYGSWGGGEAATEVSVPIGGGVTWRFEDGAYVMYRQGSRVEVLPNVESNPVALTRDTLIVLSANQKSAGYTDSAGAEVPTFDVVGSGDLYVFHHGEMVEGRWSRSSQANTYDFMTGDAESLPIPGGAMYMAIVPETLDIDGSG